MKRKTMLVVLLLGLVALAACNLPGKATETGLSPEAVQTAAAATVQAALAQTQAAAGQGQAATTAAPQPSQDAGQQPTAAPAITVLPTATPQPTATAQPTATPKPCNVAHFVKDVTVDDGTVFAPGEAFTKTWRLQNVGSCTWQNYALVFDSGNQMGGPAAVAIPGAVAPGQTVDVSVNLVAPNADGEYEGYWRLRDDMGVVFGLTTGNAFWVKIKVVTPSPTPPTLVPPALVLLDFYDKAPQATWRNGNGDALNFPGANNNSKGFARYADAYVLEDGQAHTRVLETHPQWVNDGVITGAYPTVALPESAHFRAKIGFIAAANGGCGGGDVVFRLLLRTVNVAPHPVGEWHKTCTGALQAVDVDLSAYHGQTVMFYLQVDANGSSGQDWAVWVAPVVATP